LYRRIFDLWNFLTIIYLIITRDFQQTSLSAHVFKGYLELLKFLREEEENQRGPFSNFSENVLGIPIEFEIF